MYFGGDTKNIKLAISDFPSIALSNVANPFKDVLNDIFQNGVTNKNNAPIVVLESYYSNLAKTISNNDPEKAKLLHNNIAQFSATKSNHLTKQIEMAKYDNKGNILSKADFDARAKQVVNAHKRYQVAEYNTSVHRNRIIKQWQQFEGERELYPNIQWIRTRSANPRDLHLGYAGKVWAMDDPFWQSNQPGCLWNCKCSWKTTRANVTDNTEVKIVNPSPGLEGNPYYTNEIFTRSHPYYKDVQPHIPKLGSLHLPDEFAYLNYKTKKGNAYKVHFNEQYFAHLSESEKKASKAYQTYIENKKTTEILADSKLVNDVRILPHIHKQETMLRTRYFGKNYISNNANPDIWIDGNVAEIKHTTTKRLFTNLVKASKQANIVVVKLGDNVDTGWLDKYMTKKMKYHELKSVKAAYVIANGKVYMY